MAKSREPHVIIDPEFEKLIPPLTEDEYNQLKENIYDNCGLRDSIVLWCDPSQYENEEVRKADGLDYDHIIIDGHNRWRILGELRKEHPREHFHWDWTYANFDNREEAMAWMIRNQLGRRNLTAFARTELSLKLKPLLAEEAKKKQSEAGGALPQKSAKPPVEVREEIAKAANVSHDTVSKVEKILDKAPEEVKEQLRRGDVSINKAYNEIREAEQPKPEYQARQQENKHFTIQPKITETPPLVFTIQREYEVSDITTPQKYSWKRSHEELEKIRETRAKMSNMSIKTDYDTDTMLIESIALIDSFELSLRSHIKRRKEYATDETIEKTISHAKEKLDDLLNDYYEQSL